MELGIVGTCLTKHRFLGDAWNVELLTRNAELRISLFLKDGTSDWHILKLACFGKGKQGYVFFGCFSREWDLTAEICHYSKYV